MSDQHSENSKYFRENEIGILWLDFGPFPLKKKTKVMAAGFRKKCISENNMATCML